MNIVTAVVHGRVGGDSGLCENNAGLMARSTGKAQPQQGPAAKAAPLQPSQQSHQGSLVPSKASHQPTHGTGGKAPPLQPQYQQQPTDDGCENLSTEQEPGESEPLLCQSQEEQQHSRSSSSYSFSKLQLRVNSQKGHRFSNRVEASDQSTGVLPASESEKDTSAVTKDSSKPRLCHHHSLPSHNHQASHQIYFSLEKRRSGRSREQDRVGAAGSSHPSRMSEIGMCCDHAGSRHSVPGLASDCCDTSTSWLPASTTSALSSCDRAAPDDPAESRLHFRRELNPDVSNDQAGHDGVDDGLVMLLDLTPRPDNDDGPENAQPGGKVLSPLAQNSTLEVYANSQCRHEEIAFDDRQGGDSSYGGQISNARTEMNHSTSNQGPSATSAGTSTRGSVIAPKPFPPPHQSVRINSAPAELELMDILSYISNEEEDLVLVGPRFPSELASVPEFGPCVAANKSSGGSFEGRRSSLSYLKSKRRLSRRGSRKDRKNEMTGVGGSSIGMAQQILEIGSITDLGMDSQHRKHVSINFQEETLNCEVDGVPCEHEALGVSMAKSCCKPRQDPILNLKRDIPLKSSLKQTIMRMDSVGLCESRVDTTRDKSDVEIVHRPSLMEDSYEMVEYGLNPFEAATSFSNRRRSCFCWKGCEKKERVGQAEDNHENVFIDGSRVNKRRECDKLFTGTLILATILSVVFLFYYRNFASPASSS